MTDTRLRDIRNQLACTLAVLDDILRGETQQRVTATEVRSQGGALFPTLDTYLAQKRVEVGEQHYTIIGYTLRRFLSSMAETVSTVDLINSQLVLQYRQRMITGDVIASTINHHITVISAFFNWCVVMGFRDGNPAQGLKLKSKGCARKQRLAFDGDDIATIFRAPFFDATQGRLAHRWIPLIMLYSGARPEEVAQLQRQDVRWVDGHLVFDFATMECGQRRKNEGSRRLVPVHTQLLGFVGVDTGVYRGPLFPSLSAGHNGRLADGPSRWFNRTWLRDRCHITDKRKVLYSLRHSVVSQLKCEHHVEEPMIAQLVGHADSSMTTGRYGSEYDVPAMREVVELLRWPLGPA